MVDESTKKSLASIPLLKIKAGPREKAEWPDRLREEYCSLIKYVENNKEADNDWFRLESNSDGTKWWGKCWHMHEVNFCNIISCISSLLRYYLFRQLTEEGF